MQSSNLSVAKLLRSVAAALTIKKKNVFQIRAYESAADAIEHSTSEVKDLWREGRLDEIPGVGANLKEHLDEYFKIGKVSHFDVLKRGIPEAVFEFLDISGVGPKTAVELSKLGVRSIKDLKEKLNSGTLVGKGFSDKLALKIKLGLDELSVVSGRMLLPYANAQAEKILSYLKGVSSVLSAYPLGSLRRSVATVGDLDFAVSSKDPKAVISAFLKMPWVERVLGHGGTKASVVLESGLQVDLLVGEPESFGALLQHFTGSKQHNIKLRAYAEKRGYSISEYGVKILKTGKVLHCRAEDDLYKFLGMQTPPPEMREDTGEIEAAIGHKLPKLLEPKDIKGDLHTHSGFPLEPSHGPGLNSIREIVEKAHALGYKFVGVSDHPPGFTTHDKNEILTLLKRRDKEIEHIKCSFHNIRVLNGLEVDILPNGGLSVPDEGLKSLDFCIAGIHSSHKMSKDKMTARIMAALANPHVDVIAHPTGRILNARDSFDVDWEKIFGLAVQEKKLLEVNAYPDRLDLRDDLVREAVKRGVKLVINSDAHEISQMENMKYGVAVARRGWATMQDVANAWDVSKLANWLGI